MVSTAIGQKGLPNDKLCSQIGQYLCLFRDRRCNGERLRQSALPYPAATSDERAHVEVREDRVAVHRAEWAIQGCKDEIGRVYDELPGGGW